MKKQGLLLLLMLAAALLAGCASNADTLASPTPGATNRVESILPGVTESASPSPTQAADNGTMGGINSLEDAKAESEKMEEAIQKLTEVDDAYVVAVGNTALVGVKLTEQYQGKVDDRLKKMILTRAQTVDKGITRVAVTDDETLVAAVQALADALESATSMGGISSQLDELAEKIQVFTE